MRTSYEADASGATARRPNVIVIMTDDQGPWALGAAGNDEIITPHLDRLAADGLRLSRFFCASPVCSPARASFYTGLMPSAHGVHDWLAAHHVGADGLDFVGGRQLLTDHLAAAGYRCGLVGKWHLGANDRPRNGFVHWFAHQTGGSYYYDAPVVRDGQLTTEPGYLTDAFTDDACAFVERETRDHPDTPFFLALQYTAPHSPWSGSHPRELTDLYADCAFDSCPQPPLHPWSRLTDAGWPSQGEPDVRAALTGYFAAVTGVDRGVGRLLRTLADTGVSDDTLVIFTSDNGFNCGHHGVWGKGNGTYPQNMYDSSVMVPFLIRHPRGIPGGRTSAALHSAYDVVPTLLDYLGIRAELPPLSPGRSFARLLRGGAAADDEPERDIVVADEYGPVRMLRDRRWKYVRRIPDGPGEFYDLVHDPDETTNLVDDAGYRPRLLEMAGRLERWFARHSDPAHEGAGLPVTGWGQTGPAEFLPADRSDVT